MHDICNSFVMPLSTQLWSQLGTGLLWVEIVFIDNKWGKLTIWNDHAQNVYQWKIFSGNLEGLLMWRWKFGETLICNIFAKLIIKICW